MYCAERQLALLLCLVGFLFFFQLELQFSTVTTRCHLAHKGAHGFKPDGDFIFRFGGSAVVYHGKMKWEKSKQDINVFAASRA